MTAADNLMARLGNTTVAEILGSYAALLDQKHDLELEALKLRCAGESLGSARSLTLCRARRDVDRRLGIYAALATETALLLGVPS